MKVAIYMEHGTVQLVLTPESDWERSVTSKISGDNGDTSIMRGGFYECQGGWVRQSASNESLIIRFGTDKEGKHE